MKGLIYPLNVISEKDRENLSVMIHLEFTYRNILTFHEHMFLGQTLSYPTPLL